MTLTKPQRDALEVVAIADAAGVDARLVGGVVSAVFAAGAVVNWTAAARLEEAGLINTRPARPDARYCNDWLASLTDAGREALA